MYDEVKNKELHSLVEEKKFRLLRDELSTMNEFDIAEFMGELDAQGSLIVFRMLPKEMASSVFAFLEPENKEHIISSITDKELSFIIEELYLDDAVDMLEELPAFICRFLINIFTFSYYEDSFSCCGFYHEHCRLCRHHRHDLQLQGGR